MVKQKNKSSFYTENNNNDQLRRPLSFTFRLNFKQQRETAVLESMPFQALSCEGGAQISICSSKALIEFRWEALQESCAIAFPDMSVVVDRRALRITRVFAFDFAYTGSALTWFDYSSYAIFHPYATVCTAMHLRVLRYPIRLSI